MENIKEIKGVTEDERLVNAYNLGHRDGYNQALDDNHILHGDAAVKFIKEMAKEPDEKQKQFIYDCLKMMNESKKGGINVNS